METQLIRKSNYLIEASYMLSVIEQKLILFLISSIKSEDEDFMEYPLKIKDFQTSLGNDLCNYEDVINIAENLQEKTLHIVYPDKDGKKVRLQLNWLSSTKHAEGSGVVNLRFDPNLKPFLLQLKSHFTKYRRVNIAQLKSRYSIRIYELLKQYEKLGQRLFEYPNLRSVLGIPEDQYQQYTDFRKKVILIAQVELVEKTDISFDFEELRKGHGVGQIRFFIKSKTLEQAQLSSSETVSVVPIHQQSEPPESDDLKKLIAILPQDYRAKESLRKLLKTWLEKQNFDYVARNIEYANEGSNAIKPGTNPAKKSNYRNYLAKALNGDFGLPRQEDKETEKKAEEVAKRKAKEEATAEKQRLEQVHNEKANHERALVYQKSLTPEGLAQLRDEAISRMDPKQQELVKRKIPSSKTTLQIMVDRISRERMKIS